MEGGGCCEDESIRGQWAAGPVGSLRRAGALLAMTTPLLPRLFDRLLELQEFPLVVVGQQDRDRADPAVLVCEIANKANCSGACGSEAALESFTSCNINCVDIAGADQFLQNLFEASAVG